MKVLAFLFYTVNFTVLGGVLEVVPECTGHVTLLKDKSEYFSFLVEYDALPQKTVVTIKPKKFSIKAGKEYFIHSSIDMPYEIVSAKQNDQLVLNLPKVKRASFTVSPVKGGNLLLNGSYEQAKEGEISNWKAVYSDGINPIDNMGIKSKTQINNIPFVEGKDTVNQSDTFHRTGKFCLEFNKKSYQGTMALQAPSIPVEAGQSYYVSGFYYPARFSVGTTYFIKVKLLCNGSVKKVINDRYWLSFPPYWTKPGEWRYTFNKIVIPKNWTGKIEAQISIEMDGDPGVVYWDDLDFRLCPVLSTIPGKTVNRIPLMSQKQLDSLYSQKTPATAMVARCNDKPVLEVNGNKGPILPFGSRNSSLIKLAGSKGIDTVVVMVHMNRWLIKEKSIWQARDKYNWKILDDAIYDVLSYSPNSKIILFISGGAYTDFAKDFPDSAWVSSDGKKNHHFFNAPAVPAYSLISWDTRREIGKAYRLLGEHIAAMPLGKSVIGVHIGMASDAQWYPPVKPWSYKNFDYSEGSRQSIIQEIRELYQNDEKKLQKSWNKPDLTFEKITIPKMSDLQTQAAFLDNNNGTDKWVIDVTLAYHKAIVKTMNELASEFKKGVARPVVALTYFPQNCVMAKK